MRVRERIVNNTDKKKLLWLKENFTIKILYSNTISINIKDAIK